MANPISVLLIFFGVLFSLGLIAGIIGVICYSSNDGSIQQREPGENREIKQEDAILLHNDRDYHYETIESLYKEFATECDTVYVYLKHTDPYFKSYFSEKYPGVKWLDEDPIGTRTFKRIIHVTKYPYQEEVPGDNEVFIMHDYDPDREDNVHEYYLSPFGPRYVKPFHLPYAPGEDKETNLYVIQGSYSRRRFDLVKKILDECDRPYKLLAIGKGDIPEGVDEDDRITFLSNSDFQTYHRAISRADGIIPAIEYGTNERYYRTKLTSSASYAVAYNLRVIADEEFFEAYGSWIPQENQFAYRDGGIVEAFCKSLK